MTFKEFLKINENGSFDDLLEEQSQTALTEAPIAEEGDFRFGLLTAQRNKFGMDSYWKEIGKTNTKLGELLVFKSKSDETRILGEFRTVYDEVYQKNVLNFFSYAEISLEKRKFCNKEYFAVTLVTVKETERTNGLATELYKFLVQKEKLSLISDDTQYFGARKLWARLSHTLKVDVINTETCEIKPNIVLKHGDKSKEYDEKYWSSEFDSSSKQKIRFILRDIKI